MKLNTNEAQLLNELAESNEVCVTAAVIAPIIGAEAQALRTAAHKNPDALGFPVIVMGSRVYIPRIPFLKAMGVTGNSKTT